MSNDTRDIFSGLKARKPQYVLGTKNGDIRTSNVTEEKILDAIDDIEDNECVYLEKCVPVVLVSYAKAYSIDYFKDSSIAVCFMVNGYMLRMWRSDVDCDMAADIMCDFFRTASLPDMTGWHCQKIHPEQEKAETKLCVDGEDFRYFDMADVFCALEDIIEGKSLWMLYDFTKGDGGYINISRRDNDTAPTTGYKVEYVRWSEPVPIGYRGVTFDVGLLRNWLLSLIDGERLPDPLSCWEEFDVNDYFGRLVFRFLDEEKMKGKYSKPVKTAVKLIWSSFDRDEIRRGYSILILEAQKGDADALAFIARCFMGESYVWPQAGFKADDENASKLMQKSAMMGSATGVFCAARSANLTPSVERAMPFASFKEAFEEILGQAERGDAFCCYMVGNVYYWGDYLRVEPDYAKQFKDESDYNAWAWPIAKVWYERSFDCGLCAGWGNYCDIRKSGLCEIAQDVYEKYYLMLADISPVICNNYGYYLRTEKGNSYGGLLRYVEAARRGDPQAAYNAGHIYEAGEEVDENIDLAYQLYEMAAKCGHPAGQFEVGYYLFEGFGDVEQDYAKAVEWFEKAYWNPKCSEVTKAQCAAYLGICYQEGLGTVQDDDVAFEYLHEAGDGVDNLWDSITVRVLTALGVAYAFGRGTEADIELGYQYFEDAVKLGSEEAQKYIGYINSPDYEADERKKEEPATPVAPFWQNVAAMIRDAVAADLREILGRIDDERIYTVALVTDRYCCSLFLAVNTLEYLESEDEEPDDECKWHPDEWGYSDGHDSELVKLSKTLWENHNTLPGEAFFFSAMISAMKQVKDSEISGERTEKITWFISISDDEDAENLEDSSAMTLNSPELAASFLNRRR